MHTEPQSSTALAPKDLSSIASATEDQPAPFERSEIPKVLKHQFPPAFQGFSRVFKGFQELIFHRPPARRKGRDGVSKLRPASDPDRTRCEVRLWGLQRFSSEATQN